MFVYLTPFFTLIPSTLILLILLTLVRRERKLDFRLLPSGQDHWVDQGKSNLSCQNISNQQPAIAKVAKEMTGSSRAQQQPTGEAALAEHGVLLGCSVYRQPQVGFVGRWTHETEEETNLASNHKALAINKWQKVTVKEGTSAELAEPGRGRNCWEHGAGRSVLRMALTPKRNEEEKVGWCLGTRSLRPLSRCGLQLSVVWGLVLVTRDSFHT